MKFIIKRASEWDDAVKPCEEAKLEKIVFTEVVESLERNTNDGGKTWYTDINYFNHRKTENNEFARDFYENMFTIEINTLEELMAFKAKYGDIILEEPWQGECEYQQIKIYDDYIE